jgi:Tfp pilus assembly protein PilO
MTERRTVWQERLTSALTWHYVATSLMLVVVIVLGTRFALDWAATSSRTSDVLAGKQVELKALQIQTAPLRGLDKRVSLTRDQIKDFYDKRIPSNESSIAEEIGDLGVKSGVRLSRVQYALGLVGHDLTEVSMDAGLTGQYPQVMHFINSLERDKTFFVIRAMGLTGQQGGIVNLRLRVSTWMRPEDVPNGLPPAAPVNPNAPSAEEGQKQ